MERMRFSRTLFGGGLLFFGALTAMASGTAWAGDGPTEALDLRYQAELEIARERAVGRATMADAMKATLPNLLREYLVTRDGTVAMDAVDAAYVQEQFKLARAMEEPGVALALEVFSGPGTGYENELRANLSELASFHSETAGVAERGLDREAREAKDPGQSSKRLSEARFSEKSLDAFERQMERRMEKIQEEFVREAAEASRFDAKLEAKVEARLDAVADRVAEKVKEKVEEKAENSAPKAEEASGKAQQKPEEAAEVAEVVAEEVAPVVAEGIAIAQKDEEASEEAQEKTEEAAEEVEKDSDKDSGKEGKRRSDDD